jgi:hypothetical protein
MAQACGLDGDENLLRASGWLWDVIEHERLMGSGELPCLHDVASLRL